MTNGGTIRAFIAIDISSELSDDELERMKNLQNELYKITKPIKLVELKNIHLTLKFLGNISMESATELKDFLETEVNPQIPAGWQDEPHFAIQGLGDFGKRVFFLKIRGDQGDLNKVRQLHDIIDDYSESKLGLERDTKFKFHITIARRKIRRGNAFFDEKAYHAIKKRYSEDILGNFYVRKIYLKKSTLTPKGPIYETL